MKRLAMLGLSVLVLVLFHASADALVKSYSFIGNGVLEDPHNLLGDNYPGAFEFYGSFDFDDTPQIDFGQTHYQMNSLKMYFPGFSVQGNASATFVQDRAYWFAYSPLFFETAPPPPWNADWGWGEVGINFSGTPDYLNILDPSDFWFFYVFDYEGDSGGYEFLVNGAITSITPAGPHPVPEPSTLVLAGLGTLAAVVLGRRRLRASARHRPT